MLGRSARLARRFALALVLSAAMPASVAFAQKALNDPALNLVTVGSQIDLGKKIDSGNPINLGKESKITKRIDLVKEVGTGREVKQGGEGEEGTGREEKGSGELTFKHKPVGLLPLDEGL